MNDSCRAILFDLGGVVITLSFQQAYRRWAEISGLPVDEVRARFKVDAEYERYEKGLIDTGSYIDHVSELMGHRFDPVEFKQAWNDVFVGTADGIEQLLARLHRGRLLLALTNTNPLHYEAWANRFDGALRHFDEIYCSFEIGARKPEPEAFAFVLRAHGLDPGQVLFIDDGPANVASAEACGIRSILAKDGLDLTRELSKYGVNV